MFFSSVWNTAAEREASEVRARDMRSQAQQTSETDQIQVELYEIVVAEVSRAVTDGAR
jgi:hypothetical protein